MFKLVNRIPILDKDYDLEKQQTAILGSDSNQIWVGTPKFTY